MKETIYNIKIKFVNAMNCNAVDYNNMTVILKEKYINFPIAAGLIKRSMPSVKYPICWVLLSTCLNSTSKPLACGLGFGTSCLKSVSITATGAEAGPDQKQLECAASNGNRYPPYPQVMATAISQ